MIRFNLVVVLGLISFLAAGCGSASNPAPELPAPVPGEDGLGRLVIIGGSLSPSNEAVYREVLDGRAGDGPVCVIPTAGGNPRSSMESAVERIEHWGGEGAARGVYLPSDSPERAHDPNVAQELRECSGFFFTGGAQSRVVDLFLPNGIPTPAYEAVMERFRAGAVLSGSSAGAAMMSDPMIAGGDSEGAFRSGVRDPGENAGVLLTQGMSFLPGTPVDQHFLARGRIGRLMVAILEQEDISVGWGVDEDAALVLDGREGRVVGASGVILLDGRSAVGDPTSPAAGRGLRIHLLGPGDRVDLESMEVAPDPSKRALAVDGDEGTLPEGELFDRWYFLHLLHYVGRNQPNEVAVEVEGHRVKLRPGQGFRALAHSEPGPLGTPYGLSIGPLEVEVEVIP